MKHIIVGTDRAGSNSRKVAELVYGMYQEQGEDIEILDLKDIAKGFADGSQYGNVTHPILKSAAYKIEKSDGLIVVVP